MPLMFRLKLPDDADADPADVLDVDSQADSPVGDTPDSAERNNNCEVCLSSLAILGSLWCRVDINASARCVPTASVTRDTAVLSASDISFVLSLY